MKDLVENIKKAPGLESFFEKLWIDSSYSKVFFAHEDEIFPYLQESGLKFFRMEFLYWSNLPTTIQEKEHRFLTTVIDLISKKEKIKQEKLLLKIWSLMGISEINWEGIRDYIMYYLIKFVRSNDKIKSLINEEDFTLKNLKETLKNYEEISLDSITDELEIIFEGKLDKINDELLRGQLTKIKNKLKLEKLVQFISSLFLVSLKLSDIMYFLLLPFKSSDTLLDHFINMRGLKREEYETVLEELYLLRLIEDQWNLFWCEKCIESPQILLSRSTVEPSKLRIACLKCNSEMHVLSMIEINEFIVQRILSQDGLLSTAVAWLLDEKKLQWDYKVFNKYEKDFVCELPHGNLLIEIKMYHTAKNETSIKGILTQDIKQLVDHIKELKEGNQSLIGSYLVYNFDLSEFAQSIKNILEFRFPAEAKEHNIRVIGYNRLTSVLDELKK